MEDRVSRTRATYDVVAAKFLQNTRDRSDLRPALDKFAARLSAGSWVLDIGAGPGTDSKELRDRGLNAVSLDISAGMLREGVREFPGPRVQADARCLPFGSSSIDGVWANASLLHLSPIDVAVALREIHRVLRDDAPLYLSVKQGEGSKWESHPYSNPRWFQYWSARDLDTVLLAEGFALLSSRVAEGRRGSWLMRLVSCVPSAAGQPRAGKTGRS